VRVRRLGGPTGRRARELDGVWPEHPLGLGNAGEARCGAGSRRGVSSRRSPHVDQADAGPPGAIRDRLRPRPEGLLPSWQIPHHNGGTCPGLCTVEPAAERGRRRHARPQNEAPRPSVLVFSSKPSDLRIGQGSTSPGAAPSVSARCCRRCPGSARQPPARFGQPQGARPAAVVKRPRRNAPIRVGGQEEQIILARRCCILGVGMRTSAPGSGRLASVIGPICCNGELSGVY